MRKFCIGDIRGDLYLLTKLIDKIAPTENDVLIFLGSYIGPGSDSKGVVDYLLELRKKPGTYIFLKGCYEFMFLQCIGEKPPLDKMALWSRMGGRAVFKSYESPQSKIVVMAASGEDKIAPTPIEIPLMLPEPHIRFFERDLHGVFKDDVLPFVACHNGFYAGALGTEGMSEEFSVFTPKGWLEDPDLRIPDKDIVFSHVPQDRIQMRTGKINIDLGAGLGGKLAALEMHNLSQVIARRNHG